MNKLSSLSIDNKSRENVFVSFLVSYPDSCALGNAHTECDIVYFTFHDFNTNFRDVDGNINMFELKKFYITAKKKDVNLPFTLDQLYSFTTAFIVDPIFKGI